MFPHNLFALAPRATLACESKAHTVGGASFRRGGHFWSPSFVSTLCSCAALLAVVSSASAAANAAVSRKGVSQSLTSIRAQREVLPSLDVGTRGAALAEKDGVLFLTGGDDKGAHTGRVDRFDPQTGEWSQLTDAVTPRSFGGAAIVGDWLVIVGGRNNRGPEATTELVHTQTGEVLIGAALPTPRWNAGVAAHDGLIFVAGGTHGWARLDVVEAYDIDEDRWLAKPALSVARDAALVSIDDTLFAIGGYAGQGIGATRVVERLESRGLEGERFVAAGALALPMSAFAVASVKGRAVLFGDFASASRVVSFTPKTGRTELIQTAFTPRRQASAVATGSGVVVVGGRLESGAVSSTVERFVLR